ncbi:hypothetical protein BJ875DRAFT_379591, partial [Amylocarpus encephaloides]
FRFAFNDLVLKNKREKGGDLITANRKTFSTLVGTRSSIVVGFLKGYSFNTPYVYSRATKL